MKKGEVFNAYAMTYVWLTYRKPNVRENAEK